MEALKQRGVQLTVVEMGDRMVPRMMGPAAGGMIRRWCERQGVRVLTGTRIEAIEHAAPLQARLSSGERVAALNMAGQQAELRGVTQINVLDTLGLISTSFGPWQGVPGGERAEWVDEAHHRVVSLAFDGDRLIGSNTVGRTECVGALRGLVRLGPWKEVLRRDPTQFMAAYLARAQGQGGWNGAADARRR